MTPSAPGGPWTEAVIDSFRGAGDTMLPWGLFIAHNGSLYGTSAGLNVDAGQVPSAVFELAPPAAPGAPWTETILDSMGKVKPYGTLVQGKSGVLYGTTRNGGIECWYRSGGCGTLYALTPPTAPGGQWKHTRLYAFSHKKDNGGRPFGGLVIDRDGVLYGTTSRNGASKPGGTVFELRR